MRTLKVLLSALLLTSTAFSQTCLEDIPTESWRNFGIVLRRQAAHIPQPWPVDGSQIFGVFTDTNNTDFPSNLGLGYEVKINSNFWLFAGTVEPSFQAGALQMSSNEYAQVFFSLTLLGGFPSLLPLGMPGHDVLFCEADYLLCPDSSYELLSFPDWNMTQDMSNISLGNPWNASFRCIMVPNNPNLIGQPYSAQSIRLQWGPSGPSLFASDEVAFGIS